MTIQLDLMQRPNLVAGSYASATNTTNTLVTASANTGGVDLFLVNYNAISTIYAGLLIDGNLVTPNANFGGSSFEFGGVMTHLYIEAGKSIALVSNDTALTASCYYKAR